ncbi:hypothetical protein AAMO2058_001344800 [Amorphochlora amoebiformis]
MTSKPRCRRCYLESLLGTLIIGLALHGLWHGCRIPTDAKMVGFKRTQTATSGPQRKSATNATMNTSSSRLSYLWGTNIHDSATDVQLETRSFNATGLGQLRNVQEKGKGLGQGWDGRSLMGVRVGLVTFELQGLKGSGGIGTYVAQMAMLLSKAGANVTIIFYHWNPDLYDTSSWWPLPVFRKHSNCSKESEEIGNIRLTLLPISQPVHVGGRESWHSGMGLTLMHWLQENENNFDFIHSPDNTGVAFWALHAQRCGLVSPKIKIVTVLHGGTLWARLLSGAWPSSETLELDWYESQSIALSDYVISPSSYMLKYLQAHGVLELRRLIRMGKGVEQRGDRDGTPVRERRGTGAGQERDRGGTWILRNPLVGLGVEGIKCHGALGFEEIVFFGRLEPRKGLLLFLNALDLLYRTPNPTNLHNTLQNLTIIFQGQSVRLSDDRISSDLIATRHSRGKWRSVKIKIANETATRSPLEYLCRPLAKACRRLIVIPSLNENSPYTITESLSLGLRFIASNVGGIPELIPKDLQSNILFHPNPTSLQNRLRLALVSPGSIFAVTPSSTVTANSAVSSSDSAVSSSNFSISPSISVGSTWSSADSVRGNKEWVRFHEEEYDKDFRSKAWDLDKHTRHNHNRQKTAVWVLVIADVRATSDEVNATLHSLCFPHNVSVSLTINITVLINTRSQIPTVEENSSKFNIQYILITSGTHQDEANNIVKLSSSPLLITPSPCLLSPLLLPTLLKAYENQPHPKPNALFPLSLALHPPLPLSLPIGLNEDEMLGYFKKSSRGGFVDAPVGPAGQLIGVLGSKGMIGRILMSFRGEARGNDWRRRLIHRLWRGQSIEVALALAAGEAIANTDIRIVPCPQVLGFLPIWRSYRDQVSSFVPRFAMLSPLLSRIATSQPGLEKSLLLPLNQPSPRTPTPNRILTSSISDFSSIQGRNGWRYEFLALTNRTKRVNSSSRKTAPNVENGQAIFPAFDAVEQTWRPGGGGMGCSISRGSMVACYRESDGARIVAIRRYISAFEGEVTLEVEMLPHGAERSQLLVLLDSEELSNLQVQARVIRIGPGLKFAMGSTLDFIAFPAGKRFEIEVKIMVD